MPRRRRMRVMVVVPALAGSQERNPPVIPGIISGSESAPTPHDEKEQCKHDHGNPMIVVQPQVEAVFRQIWRVFGDPSGIAMFALSNKKPADVRPPAAITG